MAECKCESSLELVREHDMLAAFFLLVFGLLLTIAILALTLYAQKKQLMLSKTGEQQVRKLFKQLESEFTTSMVEYTFYMSGHKSIWLETDYDEFKRRVLSSYETQGNRNLPNFLSFEYKLVDQERLVYFHDYSLWYKGEIFDWDYLLHHEEWLNTPSPIKAIIDKENTARRQRTKDAKWWEFWKFDNFT